MKKHAIIPIFIPHKGCPNDCVFCNQKKITARIAAVEKEDVVKIIEDYLPTLQGRGLETIEIAFFGGSFTGIPIEQQTEYLKIAYNYKQRGLVDKIHLSTRPDYIDDRILTNLKNYGVDVIELGVQSFDEEVLRLSNRGHNTEVVRESCQLIKEYGFTLGIQLMIGLPGDSLEKCVASACEAVKLEPEIARLYPTIVINDTELQRMYQRGEYKPLTTGEAVDITKEMYRILHAAGINIIRVGLKSTDIINENGEISGDTYHPAFRQLVEGAIAREDLERGLAESGLVQRLPEGNQAQRLPEGGSDDAVVQHDEVATEMNGQGIPDRSGEYVVFASNSRCFSNMIGNGGVNKAYFVNKYPRIFIKYEADDNIPDGEYVVSVAQLVLND